MIFSSYRPRGILNKVYTRKLPRPSPRGLCTPLLFCVYHFSQESYPFRWYHLSHIHSTLLLPTLHVKRPFTKTPPPPSLGIPPQYFNTVPGVAFQWQTTKRDCKQALSTNPSYLSYISTYNVCMYFTCMTLLKITYNNNALEIATANKSTINV